MNKTYATIIKLLTLTILVCYSQITKSQNHLCYHLSLDQAKQLIEQNKYTEAIELYQSVWEAVEIKSYTTCLQRAKCHFLINQFEEGCTFFKEAIEYGSTIEKITDYGIDTLVSKTHWDSLLKLYESERKAHLFNFNFYLYDKIERMYHNDSYVRSIRMPGNDSIRYALINEIDSLNFGKFQQIISQHGYPTAKEIGIVGMNDLRYVILHLGGTWSTEKWNYLNQILLTEMERGNYMPISYSNLVDRRNFNPPNQGGIYGTMLMSGSIIPVEQIHQLDSLRRTIGLFSLKRQATLMPRLKVFPEGYVPDELSIEEILELCE